MKRTWPTHSRARNAGAWKAWPLRAIVATDPVGSATVIETLACGHAQYRKAPIRTRPDLVRSRRCSSCGPAPGVN